MVPPEPEKKPEGRVTLPRPPSTIELVLLACVLVSAAALRFVGQGWGLVTNSTDVYQVPMHPDETTLTLQALRQMNPGRGDFNPEIGHMDGTLFYYVLAGTELTCAKLGLVRLGNSAYYHEHPRDLTRFMHVARTLPALLGLLAVAAIYWFGRRAGGPVTGLVAASLMATAPIEVLSGHFARPHTLIDLLLTLVLGFALLHRQTGTRASLRLAALAAGLLASTRYAMALAFVTLPIAHLTQAARPRLGSAVRPLGEAAMITGGVFVLTCPYILLDPASVFAGIRATSAWSAPPDIHRLGMEFYLRTVHVGDAGLTLPTYLFTLLGALFVVLRRPDVATVTFPWLAIYGTLLFTSPLSRDASRWLQPLLPTLTVFGGLLAADLIRRLPIAARGTGRILVPALLVAMPVARSVAFDRLLSARDPRLDARAYVEATIPKGTAIGLGRNPDVFALGIRNHAGYPLVFTNQRYQALPPIPAERDVPLLLASMPEWYMVADTQFQRLPGVGYRRSMSEAKYDLLFGPRRLYDVSRVFSPAVRVPLWPMGRSSRVIEECVIAPTVYLLHRRRVPEQAP